MPRMTARRLMVCLLLSVALAVPAGAQIPIEVERRRGHEMLTQVAKDLREYHVDPRLRGVDLDALLGRARRRIDSAGSLGEVFTAIAGVCLDLRDSHTRFLPPARVQVVDYGWTWQAYGDRTLVDWVDEGSQAWKTGLRPGDEVVQVAGMPLTRQNHHTVRYVVNQLRPQPGLQIVTLRGGVRETHQIAADIKTRKKRFDLENALDLYALEMQRRLSSRLRSRNRTGWPTASSIGGFPTSRRAGGRWLHSSAS
jgi:C-terminal processing protease CtpA/Prc